MKVSRGLLILLGVSVALGGLGMVATPDGVLARCFPSGELPDASRYYARHWAVAMSAMGLAIAVVGWRGDHTARRLALGAIGLAYLGMVGNFWLAYTAGWIPYVDTCVNEEIGFEIGFGALLIFAAVWEFTRGREADDG